MLFHSRIIGLFTLKVLFPITDQTEFIVGTLILFPILVQPVSTKKPSSVSLGFKKTTLSLMSISFLYALKDRSSKIPPCNEIEPFILSLSILILLVLFIDSSLETVVGNSV